MAQKKIEMYPISGGRRGFVVLYIERDAGNVVSIMMSLEDVKRLKMTCEDTLKEIAANNGYVL